MDYTNLSNLLLFTLDDLCHILKHIFSHWFMMYCCLLHYFLLFVFLVLFFYMWVAHLVFTKHYSYELGVLIIDILTEPVVWALWEGLSRIASIKCRQADNLKRDFWDRPQLQYSYNKKTKQFFRRSIGGSIQVALCFNVLRFIIVWYLKMQKCIRIHF